ncbi:MAG: hypothetical protein LBJ70_05300 [Holosporales bacterium]|jgi:hypothetical protein|nr:hypothetical protein [Holosporales bacterium]
MSASSASTLLKINRNTINSHYRYFRELIVRQSFEENSRDFGVFELDESYFGAKRVRGKRGRGAARRTPVFGWQDGRRDESVRKKLASALWQGCYFLGSLRSALSDPAPSTLAFFGENLLERVRRPIAWAQTAQKRS